MLAVVCSVCTGIASAEVPIVESENVTFSFGGYARAYSAWSQPLDSASRELLELPDSVGIGAAILRTELKLNVTDVFGLDVHSRFFQVVQSEAVSANAAGIGVSTAPPRTVNLSTDLVRTERYLLNHDLDRLAARLHLGPVDLTFGRQAITWGIGQLFPILDFWTSFSPFDLDTSQKRGVDGLRVTWGVNSSLELDFVVVDRGSWEDLSGGMRAVLYLDALDLHVGFSKAWEELVLSTSLSAALGAFKLRAEVAGVYDLDDAAFQLPRATLGVDWFATGNLIWSLEAHYSGLGAQDSKDYIATASSEEIARGELYLLGAAYIGTGLSYKPHELLTLGTTALVNLLDPSAMVGWSISWALQQDIEIGFGGFHGIGAETNNLQPQAEFPLYGQQVYLQCSAFF
jgi:hypothetical protein